jgi:hypothetical protein
LNQNFSNATSYFQWAHLTAWSTVLLEKLTVTHLIKKFCVFHANQSFITVFTRASHWSLSRARCIQSTEWAHLWKKISKCLMWIVAWLQLYVVSIAVHMLKETKPLAGQEDSVP